MTLRNVPKAHTLEQQRQEINLIATDLNTAIDGVQTFGGDKEFTGDVTFVTATFTGRVDGGSSTLDNAAFVGSANHATKGVFQAYHYNNGSVWVAGGANGVTTSEIKADGGATFAANVDARNINASRPTTNLDVFSGYGGGTITSQINANGSAAFQAGVDVRTQDGQRGLTVNSSSSSQNQALKINNNSGSQVILLNHDGSAEFTGAVQVDRSNSGDSCFITRVNGGSANTLITADGSATFAGILESSLLVNTNNTPTAGEGIEMFYDASASGGAAGGIQAFDRDSNALTRLKIRSSNWEIMNDGLATFSNTVKAQQTSNNALSAFEAVDTNGTRFKVTGAGVLSIYDNTLTEKVTISSDGSSTFADNVTVGPYMTSPYLKGMRLFPDNNGRSTLVLNGDGAGETAVGVYDGANSRYNTKLQHDGSALFGAASNSTGNNGVLVGGNNGSLNIYTDRYTTDCFQILNTTGSGTNVALQAFGNGNLTLAGSLTSNGITQYTLPTITNGGQLGYDDGTKSLRLYANSSTNADAKIQFHFNQSATAGITFEQTGAIKFPGQTNSSTGNAVIVTSTSFDHYEQGTFAPYFGFGLTSPTYAFNAGDYIRIGNVVHFYLTISATGTNTADAIQILGLPYAAAGTDGGSASFSYNTGWVANGDTMPNTYISNAGRILFYDPGTGNSWNGLSGNGLSGAVMYIGGHYICA